MERVEQLYRNNYSIYNYMFYNVYYGIIGKRCFTPRWRCVSYMEFAPLAPPLYFGAQPMPRSCRRSSTLRSESGNRTYSITAKRMISGLVLKYLNGECFVIRRGYETARPVSSSFCLTVPSVKLNSFHCSFTFVIEYSHSGEATKFESEGLIHLFK